MTMQCVGRRRLEEEEVDRRAILGVRGTLAMIFSGRLAEKQLWG